MASILLDSDGLHYLKSEASNLVAMSLHPNAMASNQGSDGLAT